MPDMPPMPPGEAETYYHAGVLIMVGTAIGGAVRWIWDKLAATSKSRDEKLAAREDDYVTKLERRIAELESNDRQRAKENVALRVAFEIVAAEVRRANPDSPELKRAETLLTAAFGVPMDTPSDMIAALARMV